MVQRKYVYILLALLVLVLLVFAWKNFRLSLPGLQEFTPAEQAYADSLSKTLGCDVRVSKDAKVVVYGGSGGNCYLILENSDNHSCLCGRDSLELPDLLRPIALGFARRMDLGPRYDSLIILVQTIERIPGMETPVCSQSFSFPMRGLARWRGAIL